MSERYAGIVGYDVYPSFMQDRWYLVSRDTGGILFAGTSTLEAYLALSDDRLPFMLDKSGMCDELKRAGLGVIEFVEGEVLFHLLRRRYG